MMFGADLLLEHVSVHEVLVTVGEGRHRHARGRALASGVPFSIRTLSLFEPEAAGDPVCRAWRRADARGVMRRNATFFEQGTASEEWRLDLGLLADGELNHGFE